MNEEELNAETIRNIRNKIKEAVEAEREECAKVCEPQEDWDDPLTAYHIAAAIRARGQS